MVLFILINFIFYFLVKITYNILFKLENVYLLIIILILAFIFGILKYNKNKLKILYFLFLGFLFLITQYVLSIIDFETGNINLIEIGLSNINIGNILEILEKIILKYKIQLAVGILIICIFIVSIIYYMKNKNKIESEKNELFPERKKDLIELKTLLDYGEKSILIDDKWGNGKTFFIRKFMEKYNKEFEFIYIKAPYFTDKLEFRKKILNEIKIVLNKNGFLSSNFKELTKYFGIEFKGIVFKGIEETYDTIIRNINNEISKMDKKIILILDDLDRIDSNNHIIETLNFIGEINLELEKNFSLITLTSKNKLIQILNSNDIEGEMYYDKYFSIEMQLRKLSFEDLVEYFSGLYSLKNREIKILKEIKNKFSEKNGVLEYFKKKEKRKSNLIEEWNESIKKEFLDRITIRNIEKIIINLRKIELDADFIDDYIQDYILLKTIQTLVPTWWEKMKLEPNLKKYKFNEKITEKKELENKFLDQEFIFDFIDDRNIRFRNLINYEVGGYTEKISIYDRQRNEILNNTKQDFIYQDYFNIASIFSFKEDDKVKILVSLFENKTLSQLEILFLLVKFKISYYIKYENFNDFKKDLELERSRVEDREYKMYIFYEILKFLKVNLFFMKSQDNSIENNFNDSDLDNINQNKEKLLKFFRENLINKRKEKELQEILDYLISFKIKRVTELSEKGKIWNIKRKEKISERLSNITEYLDYFSLDQLMIDTAFESGINFDGIKQLFLEVLEEEYIEKNKFYKKIYEEIKLLN